MVAVSEESVVLIVEDERDLADLYSKWVAEEHEVRTAYTGEEATKMVDEDVDAVLLDRRLPGMSGDDFLEGMRERGYSCPVAMVSAVEPDFDILEMGFEDYVVKPVSKDELLELVDDMLGKEEASADVQEYFSLASKKNALEREKTETELEDNEEYQRLVEAVEGYREQLVALAEDTMAGPGNGGFDADPVYRDALEQWRSRLDDLEEDDPLYDAVVENVRKYEGLLESEDGDPGSAEQAFMETVADSFVADDVWLDSRILEALNYVLFGKFDDTLVIERTPLNEDADLSSAKRYQVSEAVRERARQELEGSTGD